jgi:putative ATP-dependent endonuclease of the OLD family
LENNMKIKKLEIDGFRCLCGLNLSFEDDLTVLVGENDAGKSSLVDCLKVITQDQPVELDDFNYDKDTIQMSVEIEDFVFFKTYKRNDKEVEQLPMTASPSTEFLNNSKAEFSSEEFDLQNRENDGKLRSVAKTFGLVVRSNSNMENLKQSVLDQIDQYLEDPTLKIENAQFPKFNNIQLDGRHFENVSSFFREVFLKEKQGDIWQEKINDETSIEDFIKKRIDSYSDEISTKMNERGIKGKIQLFLKDLTDIRVEPIYQTKDLNIDAKVKFLENGREINLQKKGDGTKRRITMALLEFKKDEEVLEDDETTLYLLDEPDTHLHVRAQIELLETLQEFALIGHQVILTTHSPFIINSLKPNQIRLLLAEERNCTKVRYLTEQPDIPTRVLQSIGVENIYLFFARTIILTEGETEKVFITNYFYRKTDKTLSSNLIKIINVEGINNIPGFARGILEIHQNKNILVVCDNDASDILQELIDALAIDDDQKYIIGTKEFEDSFSDEALFNCWRRYCEVREKNCPKNWTVENLRQNRETCLETQNGKFSNALRQLNAGGIKMTKPIFGSALADFIEDKQIPPRLAELLTNLYP